MAKFFRASERFLEGMDDGYRRMLCIEAAAIDKPVRLDAGRTWLGRQTLTAR